jgi:hypothetical protein
VKIESEKQAALQTTVTQYYIQTTSELISADHDAPMGFGLG